ncbi:hypothetical protein ACFOU2_11280 [Bacillus songklensis]|uniref:Uncharacterized protein n=1 Tax=Bacillus songklensis TaxID=1069116 RepID=A0ABV8B419_9BACI
MRLKDGDFYTNVMTNKVYKLNEDDDGSWYLSMRDEEGYHQTSKTSGRDMIKSLEGFYKKAKDS